MGLTKLNVSSMWNRQHPACRRAMVNVPVGMTNMPEAMYSRPARRCMSSGPSRLRLATPKRNPMGQVVGDVGGAVHGVVIDEIPPAPDIHRDDLLLFIAHGMDDPAGSLEIMLDELIGDFIHLHDFFALDIDRAGQSEIFAQRARQIIVLDALGGVHDRVHQDQKMIGAVMAFLMFEQKVYEGLFDLEHCGPSSK